jgi:hypothetical protein
MYDLRQQQRMENALRLSWTSDVLLMLVVAASLLAAPSRMHAQSSSDSLPDAPSTVLFSSATAATANTATEDSLPPEAHDALPNGDSTEPQDSEFILQTGDTVASQPCPKARHADHVPLIFRPSTEPSCQDPLQLIVETGNVRPITSPQKGILAVRAFFDPFNALTIAFFSAVTIAADSHSAYGPGFAGWGRLMGYSAAEDGQSTFTGVFLIPSLVHEDPRYHRMPGAPTKRRILHALIHTVVSQHDDGSLMLNYATLINYPLSAEISNLYVPGVATNARHTSERILAGYATDPIGPVVAEFLPDFAKRVHIHFIFAQQILNHIALGSGESGSAF